MGTCDVRTSPAEALMKLQPLLLIAAAIGLYAISHVLDLQGDAAPFAASGVSTERAVYHLSALVLLLSALGCFIGAVVLAVRGRLSR